MSKELTRGNVPIVFLSSTCYDLKLVRANLKEFLEQELGFDVYASEYKSFPVGSEVNTVDNCIQNIRQYADVLVLIIGGRYGYETDNGKSITNLEYITAKEKHIPIYAFIDKNVMEMLKVWKDNPNANFSSVVDNIKVFEFIDSLRNKEGIWVYGFENVDDIKETLRIQIAHLLKRMINLKLKLDTSIEDFKILKELNGESLRLFLEKPIAWEYKIFGQVYKDGLEKLKDLERDYKYGISLENNYKNLGDYVEVLNWIKEKSAEFIQLSRIISDLINVRIVEALNAPGEPADIDYLVYIANKLVDVYKKALKIGIETKLVEVDEIFKGLVNYNLRICDSMLKDMNDFCNLYQEKINNITANSNEIMKIEFILNPVNLDEFYVELENVSTRLLSKID